MEDDKYMERIIKGIGNSLTVTLGTDTEKKFAWCLREVNGELMIYIHERREPGVSYFGKSDFITAFPVETILRYMERFSRKSNFNKIIDALDKTFH